MLAKDASKNFDDRLREISKETSGAAQAIKDPQAMSKIVSDFMFATDDIVKKSRIVFPGF